MVYEVCCSIGVIFGVESCTVRNRRWSCPISLLPTRSRTKFVSFLHLLRFIKPSPHHQYINMTDQMNKGNSPSPTEDDASTANRDPQSDRPSLPRKDSSTHVFPMSTATTGPKSSRKSDNIIHTRNGSRVQSSFRATPFDDVNKLFGGLDWLLEVTTQTESK